MVKSIVSKLKTAIGNEAGQSVTEFVVILPILLLLLLVPVDFYRAIDLQMQLNSAAADCLNSLQFSDIENQRFDEVFMEAMEVQYGDLIDMSTLGIEKLEVELPVTEEYTYYVYSSDKASERRYQDRFEARPANYSHCRVTTQLHCEMKPITFWGSMFLGEVYDVESKEVSREIYSGGYVAP